uniref:RNA polymerase sigma factor SigB n=1 Tax=uncultured Nocardioidaceae bacterium TaxID=253824 RepID=A0A6J4MUW1_9ACTN|nr:MAG: RNA polymerase sigma factor SigB [uncultured Nocardioidaceae bacterium]
MAASTPGRDDDDPTLAASTPGHDDDPTLELPLQVTDEDVDADPRGVSRRALKRLAALPANDPETRAHLRDVLVRANLPLVEHLARRFANRGEPLDDLTQVGTIGLLKAIDRFSLERGVEFSTYATPTIVGEIKRHFRDRGWSIRVPRRLQEMRLSLSTATAELTQELGRSPTVAELASWLQTSQDNVLEGLESANAYATVSLDAQEGYGDEESASMMDNLGEIDAELGNVEYRAALRPLLAQLDPRDRQILMLRFFHGYTQSQIAAEIGMSQMHVSRLLTRTLKRLRLALSEE